jgi:hypothetical protein
LRLYNTAAPSYLNTQTAGVLMTQPAPGSAETVFTYTPSKTDYAALGQLAFQFEDNTSVNGYVRAVGTTAALTPPSNNEFSGNPTPVTSTNPSTAPAYSVNWAPTLVSATTLSPSASWTPGSTTALVELVFNRYFLPYHTAGKTGALAHPIIQVTGTATDPATGATTSKAFDLREYDLTQLSDGSGKVRYQGVVPADFPMNAQITAVFQPEHDGGIAKMRHPSGAIALVDYPAIQIQVPAIFIVDTRPRITEVKGLVAWSFASPATALNPSRSPSTRPSAGPPATHPI